ncbi:MAG: helix-turn-helix transcriptional regulator [Clostridia bacterium]|nr:helix-turn-helix transcriptional regulator [Clostridia bacterium]
MNLRIAENIKRLRQDSQLTQAQLADRLGVSYQAVSRWENETTYPDIELLPSIASLFGVTVDYLLGSTAEDQKESLMRDWNKFKTITDPHARVSHLRMMHRNFPEDAYLFLKLCAEVPSIEEKRQLTAELLRSCAIPYIRALAIRQLICAEDEDKVMSLMYDYNILEECWDELLEHRYRTRGETEKCLHQRRIVQLGYLRRGMTRMTVSDTECLPFDPAENEAGARTILRMIAAMTDSPLTAAHPVAGEGGTDRWIDERVWAGITLSCALSAKGEVDEAIFILEDAANLVSRTRALPPDTPISYRTPGLEGLDTTCAALFGLRYEPDHMREQFAHPAFAPLRDDPILRDRFYACRDVFVECGRQNCIPPQ